MESSNLDLEDPVTLSPKLPKPLLPQGSPAQLRAQRGSPGFPVAAATAGAAPGTAAAAPQPPLCGRLL